MAWTQDPRTPLLLAFGGPEDEPAELRETRPDTVIARVGDTVGTFRGYGAAERAERWALNVQAVRRRSRKEGE